jgi:hypothetical protein
MKKLIIIFLFLYSFNVCAQKAPKQDSVYYFVDTLHTSPKDRMWEIDVEGPFKYYSVKCPCLEYNQQPTFLYNYIKSPEGKVISKDELRRLKFISLPNLITLVKSVDYKGFKNKYAIFFIEPLGKGFSCKRVFFAPPRKPQINIDYEIIHSDTIKNKSN